MCIFLISGDDLYPEEIDYSGEQEPIVFQKSIEELRTQAKNLHRMEIKSWQDIDMLINISPKYGHVAPVISFLKLLKKKL